MIESKDIISNTMLRQSTSSGSCNTLNLDEDHNDKNLQNLSYANLNHNKILEMLRDTENDEETTDILDLSYNRLITGLQNKLSLLESIRNDNDEMEKLKIDHVINISSQSQLESSSLKQVVEARQQELLELLDEQIEDLISFDEDVQIVASQFPNHSENSEIEALREQVKTLEINIANKMTELKQYREEILVNLNGQTMEDRILFINRLNDKLTKSVEQMTTEINRVQSEVSSFNFIRDNESSEILPMVANQDQV